MRNQIALLLTAALTGLALTATLAGAEPAATECLAKPKGLAPAGKHWYYNTDRKTQRKCWYVDDAGEKTVAAAPRKSSVAAAPRPAPESVEPPQSVDARAELIDEPRNRQTPPLAAVAPQAPEPQAAPLQETSDAAKARDWTVASRWPDPSDTLASNAVPARSEPAPVAQSEKPSLAVAEQPAQQPVAAVDGAGDIDVGLIAAALILLVIVSGTIIVISRRGASAQRRAMRGAGRRDEMPWMHPVAAPAQPIKRRDPIDRSEVVDEIEQLLAAGRQPRPSH